MHSESYRKTSGRIPAGAAHSACRWLTGLRKGSGHVTKSAKGFPDRADALHSTYFKTGQLL
jgi:hypothetical protein